MITSSEHLALSAPWVCCSGLEWRRRLAVGGEKPVIGHHDDWIVKPTLIRSVAINYMLNNVILFDVRSSVNFWRILLYLFLISVEQTDAIMHIQLTEIRVESSLYATAKLYVFTAVSFYIK